VVRTVQPARDDLGEIVPDEAKDGVIGEQAGGPGGEGKAQTSRSSICSLISAIALAGFRFLGQAWVQLKMVWQRYSLNGSFSASSRSPVASSRLSEIQR